MKLLALLFFVGVASASIYDALDDAADEIMRDFKAGMDNAPSLKDALGLDDTQAAAEAEEEIKEEIGKSLKEALDRILEKIRDSIEKGKILKEETLDKLKEIREKLKELKVDLGEKAKELLEKLKNKLKDKAKEYLQKILERLGLDDKERRSLDNVALADFNLRNLFKKLKDAILSKIDKEALKERVEKLFGKGNEFADKLLEWINEKGDKYKQKILDLIDTVLGEKEENIEERSLSEVYEKLKEYFKKFNIELKEKYAKLGEWIKNVIGKGLEAGKDKIENLKNIAKEFVKHAKEASEETAAHIIEFLRPYKEDLGSLYEDVKEKVREIFKKKQE